MQPDACIFSDVGPDIRWVGNERGIAGDPCWAAFDPVGENGGPASPGNVRTKESQSGNRNGKQWIPAECDVSIRPGWFWHEAENARVKKPQQLINLYYQSAGRGATLLLNVPPNPRRTDFARRRGLAESARRLSARHVRAEPGGEGEDRRVARARQR